MKPAEAYNIIRPLSARDAEAIELDKDYQRACQLYDEYMSSVTTSDVTEVLYDANETLRKELDESFPDSERYVKVLRNAVCESMWKLACKKYRLNPEKVTRPEN